MKYLLALGFLMLSSCASLITREDLKECAKYCGGEKQICEMSKEDGKTDCICK